MTKKHLNQGLHNICVCKHLNQKPDYTDWVITTAFYAAMHLVYGFLLPMKIRKETETGEVAEVYTSFNELYKHCHPDRKLAKHLFTIKLVEDNLVELADDYQRLYELSKTARYCDYKFSREVSHSAYCSLMKIKKHCVPDGYKQ